MVLTSSDARHFSSVVFPALSSPSRTMRSSCSGAPFSFWMTESSPWGRGVPGEACRVPGHCRAPSFWSGELGALLAMGTLCLQPEKSPGFGSKGVQARGGPTTNPPSLGPPSVCHPYPGSPASSWACWGDRPKVQPWSCPSSSPSTAARSWCQHTHPGTGRMSPDPAYLLHITHGLTVAQAHLKTCPGARPRGSLVAA